MRKLKESGIKKIPHPKVAIFSLTSCEGCEFAILDLGMRALDLARYVDFVDWRLLKEEKDKLEGKFDIAFVEGVPVTKENFKVLEGARRHARILIALGNCAAMGGIYKIKNYRDKDELLKYVYKNIKRIANPAVNEISKYVKVDYVIPTCPINAEEFLQFIYDILAGKEPHITQNPVCYECQIASYECLLQRGLPCFGPLILGGCNAVCLKSKMPCYGCRGLLKDVKAVTIRQLLKIMLRGSRPWQIEKAMEMFGVIEQIKEHQKTKGE